MNRDSETLQLEYDPDRLLDQLIDKLNLRNDADLARALEVGRSLISKIRHRKLEVGAPLLIRMHEVSELSIEALRFLLGDRRTKFRISDQQFKPASKLANTSEVKSTGTDSADPGFK
jgi:transcriptional regulator with XRE-family HTH domain